MRHDIAPKHFGLGRMQKDGVMQIRQARGCHMVFWQLIQPLQRVPKLICSVASLNLCSGHQLLECYSLHCKTLAGYLLGKGLPSAYLCDTCPAALQSSINSNS